MTSEAQDELAAVPTVVGLDELASLAGRQLGYGRWHEILQEDVTLFAALTGDEQWIHVDPERARHGPFGATVQQGFHTLALFTTLLNELLEVRGAGTVLNYGVNRVRFPAPARVGGRLRMGLTVERVEPAGGGVQVVYGATFEVLGEPKPVCVAEVVFRYYPPVPEEL
jgi:acyl dehydratase